MYLLLWQCLGLVEQRAHLGGGEGDHLLNHAGGVGVPALERGHLFAHRGQLPVRERTHVLPVLLTLRCNEARSRQRHTQHSLLIAIWHQIYGINDHSEREREKCFI